MFSNFSKEILIIAVKGAASKTPIMPQIIPQKIRDKIIVIGCKPKASPNIFGSIIFPITWWKKAGKRIISKTDDRSVYWSTAIGIGSNTAITEPITGIKFKINVKLPKMKANSRPKNQ